MSLTRITKNTIASLIALVIVFGTCSQAFAQTATTQNTGGTIGSDANFGPTAATGIGTGIGTQAFGGGAQGNGVTFDNTNGGGTGKLGNPDAQAARYLTPPNVASTSSSTISTSYQSITSNVLGCSVGQLLASIITSGITTALNGLSNLLGVWTGFPTHDAQLNATQGFQAATSHGFQIFGVYVGVSLDSIAYCIVNSILQYIANATIAWANSGFNGNPAFVQNPDRFFQSIADQQASGFINALAYNTPTNGIQLNICSPFRTNLAVGLANAYGSGGNRTAGVSGYANYGSCGMDTNSQAYKDFTAGKPNGTYLSSFYNATQFDQNSFIPSYINSSTYLTNNLIAQKQATAQTDLNYGRGFMSYQVCTDPKNPNTCNITTPGSNINATLQNTLNAGQNRLILSNKFDQVVSAIVNNLIKISLNKLLSPINQNLPAGLQIKPNIVTPPQGTVIINNNQAYNPNGQRINTNVNTGIGATSQVGSPQFTNTNNNINNSLPLPQQGPTTNTTPLGNGLLPPPTN